MIAYDSPQMFLIVMGSVVMAVVVLRSIAQSSVGVAFHVVEERRATEVKRREDNAAAEAFGRAAASEPLALNPDGTIEEPILGVVETS
jgi:hypothetical protein